MSVDASCSSAVLLDKHLHSMFAEMAAKSRPRLVTTTLMALRSVALSCFVALVIGASVDAAPSSTRQTDVPHATAPAQGLKVPMYYDRRALHPRNQNMNQDQLDEWLRMHSKNMHWRYTHPDDRNSSDALEKRQQLGMGDYGLDSF